VSILTAPLHPLLHLLVSASAFAAVWLALARSVPPVRRSLTELWRVGARLFARRLA
jgi:hypothetical protein